MLLVRGLVWQLPSYFCLMTHVDHTPLCLFAVITNIHTGETRGKQRLEPPRTLSIFDNIHDGP